MLEMQKWSAGSQAAAMNYFILIQTMNIDLFAVNFTRNTQRGKIYI